jgi:hypothetical protein
MGKKINLSLYFTILIITVNAQYRVDYFINLANAQISFNTRKYDQSIEFYKKINNVENNSNILIGLTESYILNGAIDSGFQIVSLLLDSGYFFLDGFKENKSFEKFSPFQMNRIIESSETNRLKHIIKQKNPSLVDTLFQLYYEDQEIRRQMMNAMSKYGMFSNEAMSINSKMIVVDSLTLNTLKSLIENYGIPPLNEIGLRGSHSFFTMLQHADESYMINLYSMVKKSFKKNNVIPVDFYYFQDRVFMYLGKQQIFGSQWEARKDKKDTYKLYTIKNLKKANRLRAKYGKLPLELEVKVLNSESETINYEL